MNRGWTQEQKHAVADQLRGTSDSIPAACEKLGIPEVDDMEDELLDVGLESCCECGWWTDSPFINEDQVCEECQAVEDL